MRASQVLDCWYAFAYRFPSTPWERSARATTASTGVLPDREEVQRSRPPGRALDLGCGRGFHTAELARRGWQAVGVDLVPHAIEAADRRGIPWAHFVVSDVTHLTTSGLGTFDFFLDVGGLQGAHLRRDPGGDRHAGGLLRRGCPGHLRPVGPGPSSCCCGVGNRCGSGADHCPGARVRGHPGRGCVDCRLLRGLRSTYPSTRCPGRRTVTARSERVGIAVPPGEAIPTALGQPRTEVCPRSGEVGLLAGDSGQPHAHRNKRGRRPSVVVLRVGRRCVTAGPAGNAGRRGSPS